MHEGRAVGQVGLDNRAFNSGHENRPWSALSTLRVGSPKFTLALALTLCTGGTASRD